MALVVLGAVRSGPGTTTATLALGAVWSRAGRQPLVVEADPDGGVLAARYGLAPHPNLTELAGRTRAGLRPTDAWDHAQKLPGGLDVVVAHPAADQTHAALRTGAARIGEHLARLDHTDVLVDAGRLGPTSPSLALLEWATLIVLVARPRLDQLTALSQRLPAIREHGDVALLLVGDKPYSAAEVARTIGIDVLGVLADDDKGAAAIDGSGRNKRFRGSPLVRSAAQVAVELAGRLASEESAVELGPRDLGPDDDADADADADGDADGDERDEAFG